MNRPAAIVLGPARPDEARTMAELSRDLIEAGLDWQYTPPKLTALLRDAETAIVVARTGARVDGFAAMRFGDDRAHLILLCVRRARQRRGIGRRLVEWLIASARIAGIESIALELRADNAGAHAFYRRLGFGDRQWLPGYYAGRIAARRMALELRAPA